MSSPKRVFAHFMVGNTYPYTIDDWTADIEEASTNNIDGFALNVGKEDWQHDRVALCFEAATRSSVPFYLFLSFDMSSISAATGSDADLLCSYLAAFGNHPRMFRYQDKVLVSTFAGDACKFGQPSLQEAWAFVKGAMEKIVPVHFVPAFFIDPARYLEVSSLDGIFNWNGGWPLHLTPAHPRREIESPALDTDRHHLANLGGRTFMAAVSPWFFTHYGPDSWNKNWIYRGDDWLFVRRWEQLIAMRDSVDIVQVISWNDYGESHYICPTVRGAQPASHAWVDGFPHGPWLHLNGFFARAFKDGVYPPIQQDAIFLWGRPHPRDAHAPEDVPRPANWELMDDVFWVVVLCVGPATVSLYTGDDDSDVRTFSVGAGMTKLSRSLKVGGGMRATVQRGSVVMVKCKADGFRFEGRPSVYNFNAFTAMA
ncbi:glycoside hydrolase [Mycena galericulata]|nr:glycoside hydrolase [Mycena galericulata]